MLIDWYWYSNWTVVMMNKLPYHSPQNCYSNVGFVWWKSIFVLLPKCQCIIMNSKGAFKFACFEFAKNAQACLRRFCRITYRSFESLSRSYPIPLRDNPVWNGGRNLEFRNIWSESVTALPVLTWNCNRLNALCVKRNVNNCIYIYIYIYIYTNKHVSRDTWIITKLPVQNSVRMVQLGRVATLFGTQLLNFKGSS